MLDKIMDSIGGGVAEQIAGKAGIPLDQATKMLPLAKESLTEGVMSQVTGGNVSGLLGMFKSATGGGGGLMSNSIFGTIKGLFMKKMMTNMGVPESVAGLAAGTGMSSIVGSLAGKMVSHGDTDEVDAGSLMSVLGVGGDSGGMLGKAAGMLGGLAGGAGSAGGGLMDKATDMLGGLAGGAKESGGGLMDKATDMLGGLTGGAGDAGDSAMDKAKDLLGGIMGGKDDDEEKKDDDDNDSLLDKGKDLLGGLLG